MNPGNSAPVVVWLASDEALHVTGQVFRVVGNTIAYYKPWTLGGEILSKTRTGPTKWDPADIANEINAWIFKTRNPGLQMGRR